jgi:nucleoside-triphosphatase THEP1
MLSEITPNIAAVVYDEKSYPDEILRRVVDTCRSRHIRIVGVIQHRNRQNAHRCDMVLEDIATGRRNSIFAGRGRGARGCQLDETAMRQVVSDIEQGLLDTPDLLILNKFGKIETEGAGTRDAVAMAIFRNIPVLVGVPTKNLGLWRQFTGDLALALHSEDAVLAWLKTIGGGSDGALDAGCCMSSA